jgi:hypothetical protein
VADRSTESLLRELPQNLEPVRPIPRLRSVLLVLLGIFLVVVGVEAWMRGRLPLLVEGAPWSDPPFLTLLAGLALTAGGAIVAALAGAVPGRETAARAGRALGLAGVLLASGGGLWAVLRAELTEPKLPIVSSLQCLGRASALGLVPALFLCVFLVRAFERRPLLGTGFACVGALALGSVVVHASCPHVGALHVLMGHWASPFALALLLALPLSRLVRRFSQRG